MATTFRFNGNMGYKKTQIKMINENVYKDLAMIISERNIEYISRLTRYYPEHEKYRAWLLLLGLIETWTVIHDR